MLVFEYDLNDKALLHHTRKYENLQMEFYIQEMNVYVLTNPSQIFVPLVIE